MRNATRLLGAAALLVSLGRPGPAGIAWQEGDPAPSGRHQFLYAADGSAGAVAFERDVLGDANVQVFLEPFDCHRLDGAQARAAGLTPPALALRDGQGAVLWRRDALVPAPELITALVIHAAAPLQAVPGAAPSVPASPASPAASQSELVTDPRGDATNPALDLVSASWGVTGADLTVTVAVAGAAQIDGFHMYIDADSDASTGYSTANILGAERMVEGAIIYTHAGAAQTDWNWTAGPAATYEFTGSALTLTIPLASLGLASGQPVKVSFGFTDASWSPADWMPDGQPVTAAVP